jgi:hypothetical protein
MFQGADKRVQTARPTFGTHLLEKFPRHAELPGAPARRIEVDQELCAVLGAAAVVRSVVDALTRLTTRLAVIALCPTAFLAATTSTFAPTLKSAMISGLALVPYCVFGVIVTETVLPSVFWSVQIEPDMASTVPTTDAADTLPVLLVLPFLPVGVVIGADCGAPDVTEPGAPDAGAVLTVWAAGAELELATARPARKAATATTTTPGAIHIHCRSLRDAAGAGVGFSGIEGNSVVGGSSFVISLCRLSSHHRARRAQSCGQLHVRIV